MIYQGPIIDVHHHLWDYKMGRHKWLGQSSSSLKIVGDSRYLERDYLPTDYFHDAQGHKVVATVHAEAHWDRERDGTEETAWLEALNKPANLANRYVVWADLAKPGAGARLDQHLALSSRVIGVRESIRAHSDPGYAYAGSAHSQDPQWLKGVQALSDRKLVLDLMIYPHQAKEVAEVAQRFPDLSIVINHSASPIGTGDAARQSFREAIEIMALCSNVYVKASNFFRYSPDLGFHETLQQIALPLLAAFGPQRSMFASDTPVASRWTTYTGLIDALKTALSTWNEADQKAFFHDTAARVYRIKA